MSNTFSDADAAELAQQEAGDEVFVLPASFAQQRLWFIDQLEPGRPSYNVPLNFRLTGALDVPALEGALAHLVERHETLRTVFDAPDGEPVQVVLPPSPVPLPLTDLRALPADARAAVAERTMQEAGARPFDIRTGPVLRAVLVRLADEEHLLLLTVHHIAIDGWSVGIVQRELAAAYGAFAARREPSLPPLPIQYADFASWQRDRMADDTLEEQLEYWTTQLAAPLPVLDLLTDRPRHLGRDRTADAVPVDVPAAVSEAIVALAREAGVTPFVVLLAAYQVLLHRYTGQDDVVVGAPVAGRTRRETEGLIGLFVNTLALRTSLRGAPSFRALLARVRDVVHGGLARQDMPFERIVEAVQPERDRSRNPVFQTLFSLQDFGLADAPNASGLTFSRLGGARGVAKFDVQLIMSQRPGGFRGTFEFDASLFDVETARRMMRHFVNLLGAIVAAPDRAIGELSLVDADERRRLLVAFNDTTRDYPRDRDLVALVAEQVARTPDAPALRFDAQSLTYAELDARVRRLAAHLRRCGVGPEVVVGLSVERSLDMVVALLAIHRAGGAYLPLDPQNPAERLAFTLADAGATVLVTQEALRDRIPLPTGSTVRVVSLDGDRGAIAAASPDGDDRAAEARDPERLAYMMYTSGSTGRPKGVMVTHRNVVNTITGFGDRLPFGPTCVHVALTPLSFDISVLELFLALTTGACVVIVPRETALDARALGALLESSGATHFQATPVSWRMLVEGGWRGKRGLIGIIGGEALTPPLADALLARGVDLFNCYGPTEITIYATMHRATAADVAGGTVDGEPSSASSLPIGRPMANVRAYVLDAAGGPAPLGVPGELFIGGDGVARGYHQRPELTAERFLPDPFADALGARMYRTGDRVRWRPDGVLEFLGRLDDQVKIRGFRIELGEVEAVLAAHPGVREAAVVARPLGPRGELQLAAYYAARVDAGPTTAVAGLAPAPATPASLRGYLRERLPEYMVPAAFVRMERLPVGATGKVDRRALLAVTPAEEVGATELVPPRTTIEHELLAIWESLLAVRPIGIRDDFFELGGHSLLAVRMLHEIERVRGRRVPLAALFEHSTIESIAYLLESAVRAQDEPPLVVLQEGGSATPYAFVHGDIRGGGWYCRKLAPMLGADTPLIVLPTIRPGTAGNPVSIEDMAAVHLAHLREVQPRGPYRLGGYCHGGIVALEMALQLQAAGEIVEHLVVVDTAVPNARLRAFEPLLAAALRGYTPAQRVARRAEVLQRLRYYRGRLRAVRRLTRTEMLRWVRRNVARRLPGAAGGGVPARDAHHVDAHALAFQSRDGTAHLRFMADAQSAYTPGRFRGAVDLVWADSLGGQPLPAWTQVADTVRLHRVDSSHVGLITHDLHKLGARLRECLGPAAARRSVA